MDVRLHFCLFVAASLFFAGCISPQTRARQDPADATNLGADSPGQQSQSNAPAIPNSCFGEEECNNFCENNLGICREFCRQNSENPLCQKPFPFEGGERQSSPPNPLDFFMPRSCTSNPAPVFTKPFTDASKLLDITPIGNVRGGSPGRSYVAVQRSAGKFEKVPIYAPVDASLKGVAFAYRNYGEKGLRPEYRLDFQVSCEVSLTFDHIAEVSDKIRAVAPQTPANNTRNDKEVSLPVSAGELLGYTDGTMIAGTFDFMVLNTQVNATYANPARWQSDQLLYADCPYDYFIPELKSAYYALLNTKNAQGNPDCGRVSNDMPGSMAGGWFKPDSNFFSGLRLVAATEGDYVDIKIVDYAAGAAPLLVSQYKAEVKPEDAKPGDTLCFSGTTSPDNSNNANHIILRLVSREKLESAIGTGPCPATLSPPPSLSSQFEDWER